MLTVAMIAGVLVVGLGVVAFEHRQSDVRTLALVAMLMAVAAASRLLVPIPNAKPVLALTILAGIALGATSGAAVGAGAILISNTVLGQGPWTLWQMIGLGLAGAAAAWCAPFLRRSRVGLCAFGLVVAVLYGALMNGWMLTSMVVEPTLGAFLALEVRSIPFDAMHALATVLILATVGTPILAAVERGRRRLLVTYLEHAPQEIR